LDFSGLALGKAVHCGSIIGEDALALILAGVVVEACHLPRPLRLV
jgi:hypothetical protein